MLLEISLKAFQVLVEHVFPAKFIPASKVVDFHPGQDTCLLEHPVDLLLVAPHHVPVVVVGLFPLAVIQALKDTVSEIGFELDAGSMVVMINTAGLDNATF